MLKRGRANTLLVIKLDRLTRSVRDLCALVDDYFAHEQYHLLSACGMVNTHNAAGRILMLNLANYAQFEREIISERTYEAMQQLKAQGVKMGHPPFGYAFSQVLDDKGRRTMMPLPDPGANRRNAESDWRSDCLTTDTALHERVARFGDGGI